MEVGFIQIVVLAVIIIGGTPGIIYLIKKPDAPAWEPKEESKPIQNKEPEKELNPHIQELNDKLKKLPMGCLGSFVAQTLFIGFSIGFIVVVAIIYKWLTGLNN